MKQSLHGTFVVYDWLDSKSLKSCYAENSIGDFHHGTCFKGTIELEKEDAQELIQSSQNKQYCIFMFMPEKNNEHK